MHLLKQNCLLKAFLRTDDPGISLPVFPPGANLGLHDISVTPNMVGKVITNLDLSKTSGLDCIPLVVLKNSEPELLYIIAELFNNCLKESCFPDCWKVSSVVPVFKNIVKRSTDKSDNPVSLFSVVSKVFANNRIVDHLQKKAFFLISSMVLGLFDQRQIFLQLYLIELLELLVSDRIARIAFNRLLKLQQLIYLRLLTGFGMLFLFTSLSHKEFQMR